MGQARPDGCDHQQHGGVERQSGGRWCSVSLTMTRWLTLCANLTKPADCGSAATSQRGLTSHLHVWMVCVWDTGEGLQQQT